MRTIQAWAEEVWRVCMRNYHAGRTESSKEIEDLVGQIVAESTPSVYLREQMRMALEEMDSLRALPLGHPSPTQAFKNIMAERDALRVELSKLRA